MASATGDSMLVRRAQNGRELKVIGRFHCASSKAESWLGCTRRTGLSNGISWGEPVCRYRPLVTNLCRQPRQKTPSTCACSTASSCRLMP